MYILGGVACPQPGAVSFPTHLLRVVQALERAGVRFGGVRDREEQQRVEVGVDRVHREEGVDVEAHSRVVEEHQPVVGWGGGGEGMCNSSWTERHTQLLTGVLRIFAHTSACISQSGRCQYLSKS